MPRGENVKAELLVFDIFDNLYKVHLSTFHAGQTQSGQAIIKIIDTLISATSAYAQPFKRSSAHNNIISHHLSLDEERGTSHLLGLVKTHDSENSGSDVTKDAVSLLEGEALGSVGHDEGDLVEGVRGLGSLLLVEHLLGVAASVLVKVSCCS